MAGKLRTIAPLIRSVDTRTVKVPPKQVDSFYLSPEYRAWREVVISRAGRRCQALNTDGVRCRKAEPQHRMFADHVVEVQDGGARYDPANGKCLCGSHHTFKTTQARAKRLGS